jgi:histidinol-phosphate aminotransferase
MEKRLVRVAGAVLEIESRPRSHPVEEMGPMAGLLKLDENENTVGPSPEVSEALSEYLRTRPLNWHENGRCEEQLRKKLSKFLSLPKESISCFNGAPAAVEMVIRTYLESDVEALLDPPSDKNIGIMVRSTGAKAISIKHDNPLKPQIEKVISSITPKTRLIYLSNPNEFAGAAYTESEIVFLLAYAERVMVVVQEEFAEFCGCSMADLVMRFPNLAVIRSFSGVYGLASLNAAYLLSDPDNIELIERLKFANGISDSACVAACAALEDIAHVQKYVQAVEQSKRFIMANLPQIGYEFYFSPANFILLKVSDSNAAVKQLSNQNIRVGDLSDHDCLHGYIRITLGTPSQMEKLLVVLGRLAQALATGYNRNRKEALVKRAPVKVRETAEAR